MKNLFLLLLCIALPTLMRSVGATVSPPVAAAEAARAGTIIGELRGNAQAVAVDGEFAYVGFGTALAVVDISDKANPVEVGRVDVGDLVREIAIVQPYAYLATISGLQIIDVSDANTPTQVETIERMMTKVQLKNDLLYTLSSTGLDIFSLDAAPNLALVGQFKTNISTPIDLDLEQNYAFILDGYPNDKIRVIDVSNASQLIEKTLPYTVRNSRVAVSLPKLFAVDSLCSSQCITYLSVVDIDIDSLSLVFNNEHTVYDSWSTQALIADGLYVYVGKDIGLYVYNHHKLDAVGSTLLIDQVDVGDVKDIYVSNDYIFVASADSDIFIHPPREGGLFILQAPPQQYSLFTNYISALKHI